ncbi:MAG TPA: Gfo/Idh/MocA family oxidoreductase [Candidatus Kapabacteria bacterium]|jgi:predicted dehydrogenase|nr:Gfo/Idh/MocA family oxidoreductase [Candidatus Kapabacteria bacterium]
MPSIAIIGCGLIGETHARELAELGAPPTVFVDSNLVRAQTLAQTFGGNAFDRPGDVWHNPTIDAVYICTYHDTHAALAIEAAQHGKHIFLEKPMALTAKECREIADAIRASGVLCMTGFKLHYYSLAKKANALLPNPILLTAHVSDRRWPDGSWANDPIRGGGNVLSQGCHAVEMLCRLAGSKPSRIYADGGNLHHPNNAIVDTMAATIAFENGAVASLTIGDAGEMPHDGKFSFTTSSGTETVHLYNRLTMMSHFDGEREHIYNGEEDGFLNENREFLDALQAHRKPETDELDGIRASLILLAGIESIRTHSPQSLEHLP